MSVERFVDENWKFETVGRAEYVMGTNNLTIKIAKDLIMLSGNEINLDFKWTDNSTDSGEIMQFMDLGDCAPNDRFNFRYSSTATGEGMTARPSLLNGPSAPLSIWKWVIIGGILAAGIGAVIVFISFRRRNTGSPNGKTYNKQK